MVFVSGKELGGEILDGTSESQVHSHFIFFSEHIFIITYGIGRPRGKVTTTKRHVYALSPLSIND